jgi:glycerophosphoryl diester phosphodiesterase
MILVLLLFSLINLVISSDFEWLGHRGARGLYPENTTEGMLEALRYPVTALEMDVVISQDMKVVVSHEPWPDPEICLSPEGLPLSGPKINFYNLPYEKIKEYDCGSKILTRFPRQKKVKEVRPLLSDLLKAIESYLKDTDRKVNYSVEIKSSLEYERKKLQPDYKVLTDEVIAVLLKRLSPERFMIQSFDWRVLQYINQKYPQIAVVALKQGHFQPEDVIKKLGFLPQVFSPDWKDLKKQDVNYFHAQRVKVIPWTVNDRSAIRKVQSLGVDGIITDYPDLIPDLKLKCPKRYSLFEGKCVKIPDHAVASKKNPGWNCVRGYMQKRSRCIKIAIPKNAIFLDDGKTWVCREGFERYRYKCMQK